MAFTFTRVDDRAIHGQTVTLWSKIIPNKGILLVDDEIAGNPMMRQIYKNAAVGIDVFIFSQAEALIKAKQAGDSQNSYLLIVRYPTVLEYLYRHGVNIGKKITFGPVSQSETRKPIAQYTALNEEEVASCDYLASEGIEIVFQSIPSAQSISWASVRK
jgi:mannose/fructose/N-acetylgalactosamine-specific phosphotransferase system component IIB